MEKAKAILGEDLIEETITRIQNTTFKDDPEWLVEQRINHEVTKTCLNKPLTFVQMKEIITDNPPSNGIELSELIKTLENHTDKDALLKQNLAIIRHTSIAVFDGILNEFHRYFRNKGA